MGFRPSRAGFPASTRRAFYGSIRIWSYSLSAGVYVPASPAVRSQSARHRLHGSRSRQKKESVYFGQHASVFTRRSDLLRNPKSTIPLSRYYSFILAVCAKSGNALCTSIRGALISALVIHRNLPGYGASERIFYEETDQ